MCKKTQLETTDFEFAALHKHNKYLYQSFKLALSVIHIGIKM